MHHASKRARYIYLIPASGRQMQLRESFGAEREKGEKWPETAIAAVSTWQREVMNALKLLLAHTGKEFHVQVGN
jgi:hypothetical protein